MSSFLAKDGSIVFLRQKDVISHVSQLEEVINLMLRDLSLCTNRSKEELLEDYLQLTQINPVRDAFIIKYEEPLTLVLGDLYKQDKLPQEIKENIFKPVE